MHLPRSHHKKQWFLLSIVLLLCLSLNIHSLKAEPFYWRIGLPNGSIQDGASPSALCDAFITVINDQLNAGGNPAGNEYRRTGFAHATPANDVTQLICSAQLYAGPGSNFPEGELIVGHGRGEFIFRHGNGCPENMPLNPITGQCMEPDAGMCDNQPMRGNPINIGSGNKYQRETDYQGPAGLAFERHYNSQVRDFLPNWSASMNAADDLGVPPILYT